MIGRVVSSTAVGAAAVALTLGTTVLGGGGSKKAPEIPPRTGTSETIQLFNGKDLDGWEGYFDLWSVKDGVIVAKNTKPLKYSTYLLTKRKFSDFRLVFSAKLLEGSEMHSGVAIWGRRFDMPPRWNNPKETVTDPKAERTEYTYQGHLVMFPSGWGLYDLYRRHGAINPPPEIRNVAVKAGKQHDWNDMEILAQGNRIRLAVNGKLVLDWRDPQPELISEGPIGLQLHSLDAPQELHFKGLTLTTFPEEKMTTVK
ncbi:MAG: DUF1080 domain-containing protein [Gemmataceae bacterium]|nr:DUF1080 domain-containing protein [Gemmataceae bacterium]